METFARPAFGEVDVVNQARRAMFQDSAQGPGFQSFPGRHRIGPQGRCQQIGMGIEAAVEEGDGDAAPVECRVIGQALRLTENRFLLGMVVGEGRMRIGG